MGALGAAVAAVPDVGYLTGLVLLPLLLAAPALQMADAGAVRATLKPGGGRIKPDVGIPPQVILERFRRADGANDTRAADKSRNAAMRSRQGLRQKQIFCQWFF